MSKKYRDTDLSPVMSREQETQFMTVLLFLASAHPQSLLTEELRSNPFLEEGKGLARIVDTFQRIEMKLHSHSRLGSNMIHVDKLRGTVGWSFFKYERPPYILDPGVALTNQKRIVETFFGCHYTRGGTMYDIIAWGNPPRRRNGRIGQRSTPRPTAPPQLAVWCAGQDHPQKDEVESLLGRLE